MTKQEKELLTAHQVRDQRKPGIYDQIAFEVPVEVLNMNYKSHFHKDCSMTLHDANGKKWVHFHDLEKYDRPILTSIFERIQLDSYDTYPLFNRYISYEYILENFKLRVLELAFDSYTERMPYAFNPYSGSFKSIPFGNGSITIYSSDYRVKRKGNTDHISRKADSLICIYDRTYSLKMKAPIRSVIPDTQIWRFEFRLKGRYIRRLKTADLEATPLGLSRKLKPILVEYTKGIIMPNSIWAENVEILRFLHPYLYDIFIQCNLTPLTLKDYISLSLAGNNMASV